MLTKILVIDDDPNITDLLKMYLEKEGYEVKTAADGQEGLTTFKLYEPDLVLLDVMLPRQDGLQICREIRDHSSKPVIMISAKGETFCPYCATGVTQVIDKIWLANSFEFI